MAYEGWMEYNGTELVNVARTARLARTIGVDSVRIKSGRVEWMEGQFTGFGFGVGGFGLGPFGGPSDVFNYSDITTAPWYDAGVPASAEFAGFIPLNVSGLDDSTLESTPTEYIGDGGHSGKPRSATLPLVFSLIIVASTERGAEFGRRWLARALRDSGTRAFCTGADLRYFRSADIDLDDEFSPVVHRRDVRTTRGISVTRKRSGKCSALWWITFTMTAADPYEYGEPVAQFEDLGGVVEAQTTVTASGTVVMAETECPVFDYSPIYDPLYPALVPAPTPPNLLPEGWTISEGQAYQRKWVRIAPFEPSALLAVPVIVLTSTQEARMVRITVADGTYDGDENLCNPLFAAVVSYLPAGASLYIDGEQKAAYTWDGFSPAVRRADSLVYSPQANPVEWSAFANPNGLLIALDTFAVPGGYQGGGNVRASLALMPKSD